MKTVFAFSVIAAIVVVVYGKLQGTAKTTRYWDCCKPSCSWSAPNPSTNPVSSCAADGETRLPASARSGCDSDGTAYICNDLQPWAVNDTLAYGFVAASFTGGVDNSKCCVCLKLTYNSGPLQGKTFIVQNVNTGGDLGQNHFDVQIPGSGVGIFTRGCKTKWNAPEQGWGQQYGGVSSQRDCDSLPQALQPGCLWRFGWYENADNPQANFEQVVCPSELTQRTGCVNNNF